MRWLLGWASIADQLKINITGCNLLGLLRRNMTTKLIPTLAETQTRLHESIKYKMDDRVIKVINDSITASIEHGTNVIDFSLNSSIDSDLVINYLKIFKYDTVTVQDVPSEGRKSYRITLPLVSVT